MMKTTAARATVVAVVAGGAVLTAQAAPHDGKASESSATAKTATMAIGGSYDIDVHDLDVMVEDAASMFVAEVIRVASENEEAATTTFEVRVTDLLKGSPPANSLVEQYGYVDDDGVTHVLDDQPRLEPGRTYLLLTNVNGSADFMKAGPLAVRPVESPTQQDQLVDRYSAAWSGT